MEDILDFLKTPAGQGLLSGAFGYAANAKKGTPWNNAGRGGLTGLLGYNTAIDQQQQQQGIDIANQYRTAQMAQMQAEMEAKRKQQEVIAGYRATLPPENQQLFDVAPQDYIKNLPQFQKPQLVEMADPKEPLRTQKVWMRPGDTTGTVAGVGPMPEILDPRVQAAKVQVAVAGRPLQTTNVFNNTKDDFKNERDLRNDFAGLPTTKAFNEVQSAYDQIKVAVQKGSPAGDLAAATKIMKILDPGSVVRESELGMAMAATGLEDRIRNYASLVTSGQKLTPKQREDFMGLAEQLYGAAADRYDMSAKEYQGVAKDYNLNPGRVAKPAQRSAISKGGWSATKE